MNDDVRNALLRLRVIAMVHAVAWVATPATFLAFIIAEPSFIALRVENAKLAGGFVSLFFLLSFALAFYSGPPLVWACASLSRRAGIPGITPWVHALVAFVVPYFPFAPVVRDAGDAVLRIEPRAGERLPGWLVWMGPLLVGPCLVGMAITGNMKGGDPPASVYVFLAVCFVYGVSRVVLAMRLRSMIGSALSRPAVDDMRASHAEPVGGG